MKVILVSAAGFALAAMTVYDAVQVPQPASIFGEVVDWLGSEINSALGGLGIAVSTPERGQQTASAGDWIIGLASGPVAVVTDDAFKADYVAAPDGAGVQAAPPEGPLLALYQSHRVVQAAKINAVDGQTISLESATVPSVTAAENMFARYTPVPGDYYIRYEDGYVSICPGAQFEAAYTPYTPAAA
jgi:hypothetical protein